MQSKHLLPLALLLAACSSTPPGPAGPASRPTPPRQPETGTAPTSDSRQYGCSYQPPASNGGGFYKDDGPHSDWPANLNQIPDATPRAEPLHKWANRPYTVLGQSFTPLTEVGQWREEGVGSWYGRKFHGQKTSNGEIYDMFAMSAASPILPIPSYARVTNLANGRSVIVRVNDRGPFKKGRIIDLSFLAACRLGYASNGSAQLRVESLQPGAIAPAAPVQIASAPAAAPKPAEPIAEATPLQVPVSEDKGGVYLQLGAFSSQGNADSFRQHLNRQLESSDTARVVIQQTGPLWRVKLGPYPDRAAALAAAERLTGEHQLQAVIAR
ncbi:septal ring lytic transglycosylase RlpA family protein [Chitinilyticum piscinae]|uniref:Endolytic peptidoglycan transglycosylase RlpA n=1 Tax=Chitinilyticum piscinae TaxID=2866724 RepID=A0A8J7FH65_9NEIS|nr:septal ring lytic transglycosylase RlpA family protein [Chitinilyticum piscinae]MBE9609100.1 septal ring lytic transglycosylase RlpA family protein [Chitinilyticum piscinae]